MTITENYELGVLSSTQYATKAVKDNTIYTYISTYEQGILTFTQAVHKVVEKISGIDTLVTITDYYEPGLKDPVTTQKTWKFIAQEESIQGVKVKGNVITVIETYEFGRLAFTQYTVKDKAKT